MAETKTNIPIEIKMGNAEAGDANLPAFKEGSIIFTKDTKKIYLDPIGETERIAIGGSEVTVDSEISDSSENPVQNKVIKTALDEKLDKVTTTDTLKRVYAVSAAGAQEMIGIDTSVANSANLVRNRAIYSAVNKKQDALHLKLDNTYIKPSSDTTTIMRFAVKDSDQQNEVRLYLSGDREAGLTLENSGPKDGSVGVWGIATPVDSRTTSTGMAYPESLINGQAANKGYVDTKVKGKQDNLDIQVSDTYDSKKETKTWIFQPNYYDDNTSNNKFELQFYRPTVLRELNTMTGIDLTRNGPQLVSGLGLTYTDNSIVPKSYVDSAISTQLSSVYRAKGSVANLDVLPTLSSATEGYVYNIESEFTTTVDFVEGAGKKYPAGTNIVCINTSGSEYKWDVLAGIVDLSVYATQSQLSNSILDLDQTKQDKITSSTMLSLNSLQAVYVNITGGEMHFNSDIRMIADATRKTLTFGSLSDSNSNITLKNIAYPKEDKDAANKEYADNLLSESSLATALSEAMLLDLDTVQAHYIRTRGQSGDYIASPQFGSAIAYSTAEMLFINDNRTIKIQSSPDGFGNEYEPAALIGVATPLTAADGKITEADLPYQAVNKKYVDDLVGDINTILATIVEVTE